MRLCWAPRSLSIGHTLPPLCPIWRSFIQSLDLDLGRLALNSKAILSNKSATKLNSPLLIDERVSCLPPAYS